MQPYFLAYLGYFQLMAEVDKFVVYDNIEFSKKGWIHRNRFLMNGEPKLFSLSLKKDSDYLDVCQRELSGQFFQKDRKKMVAQLENAYRKAPFFKSDFGVIRDCFDCKDSNLFNYIFHAIKTLHGYLNMESELVISSSVNELPSLNGKDRVIGLVKELKGQEYLNPIGGKELYSEEEFSKEGIDLKFHEMTVEEYPQFKNEFVSHLSIVDQLMFRGKEQTKADLANCIFA